ncbi:hypothetical protein SAMN05660479_01795 [Microbulbifer thermotolerans]|nr:hypothetical protein SAMN05660479_01795 [Microbulbifer thermotolerans]
MLQYDWHRKLFILWVSMNQPPENGELIRGSLTCHSENFYTSCSLKVKVY